MVHFDLIGALKTYADANDMHFLSGSKWYQNYEESQHTYQDGQFVLACDFNANPIYSKAGFLTEINYQGVIMIGQKFTDYHEPSTLDETFYQKYTKRLLICMQQLNTVVREIACEHELTILSVSTTLELNKFDTNIDFAAFQLTLNQ